VEALRLVSHGLSIHDQRRRRRSPELARIAAERIQVVEDMWKKVLGARRREKSQGGTGWIKAAPYVAALVRAMLAGEVGG
jgi:hypothetical protein